MKTRKKRCIQNEISYILNKPEWETFMQKEQERVKPEYREKFENTYKYMYNEIGYGVFVQIVENKIETFQAFVNTDSAKPETNQIPNSEIEKYQDRLFYKVAKDRNHWGFNGCVFLYNNHWWKYDEFKIRIYYDMFLHLIKKNTSIINTCFFINVFDKPIISKNTNKNKYIPVLSGSTNTNHYYDKCMIYLDTWEVYRQFPFERYIRKIGKTCENQYITKVETEWKSKQNKIIFRGTNSSCYPTAFKQNIRLKMINILQKIKNNKQTLEIKIDIDIGLIKLKNKLSRVEITDHKIHFSNDPSLSLKIHSVQKKSKYEQSKCKYILCMDGYVTPWRLCFELSYGSCIFLIRSQYTSWFYHELRHKENVVIFDEASPNLEEEIREALIYYSNHDEEARRIGENAMKLYKKIMHIDYMRNYMLNIFQEPEFHNLLLTDSSKSLDSYPKKSNKKRSTQKRNQHQTRKHTT